ncbi:MAG: hypothetical protein NVSMB24_38580 [Mucilaginibacter sp.]
MIRRNLRKRKNLKQGWQRRLEDQIYELPDFKEVFRESKRQFKLKFITLFLFLPEKKSTILD